MNIFIKKVKNKISERTLDILLTFSLYIRSPYITALVLFGVSKKVNNGGDYTVLCQNRSIFIEDVKAMTVFSKRINYVTIHRIYWKKIFYHFLFKDDRKEISEFNYHSRIFLDNGDKKYYSFLEKVLPVLQKFIGFQALLSGGFGYLEQQEIAKVCKNIDIPFIVLDKEGITMVNELETDMKLLSKKRFYGSKVLFYNQIVRQAVLKNKSIGLTENNTAVVGIPRMDYYFQNRKVTKKNQIVFFAFRTDDRFSHLIENKNVLDKIFKRAEDFYKMIMDFALKHKEIKVIIKTKAAKHYLDVVYEVLQKHFKEDIFNLEITNKGNPTELIFSSRAVIGYNSTTLLEALMAGKIIISPYFGDLIKGKEWDYFADFHELINYALTLENLEEYIFNSEKYLCYDEEIKNRYLRKFLEPPFGKSSINVENEIINTIKNK